MRSHELECSHGVGHSGGIHGCDGCCSIIAKATQEHLIEMLITNKVIRRDALGDMVFVNCDTLAVEYLSEILIKGEN